MIFIDFEQNILLSFCIFLSIVKLVVDIYYEIKHKKYFRWHFNIIKKSSILWYKLENDSDYYLLDIFFDLVYVFSNLNRLLKSIANLFISLLLFKIYFWLPITYLFFFYISIIIMSFKILHLKFWDNKIEIKPLNIQLSPFDSIWKMIINFLLLPYSWAYFTVYYVLSVKNKKININSLQNLMFSLIFHKPLWFLKFIFKETIHLNYVFKNDFWWRKHYTIWFKIILDLYKMNWYSSLLKSNLTIYALIGSNKIYFDKKIKLNPDEIIQFLQKIKLGHMGFSRFVLVHVGGQYHQCFLKKNEDHGFIMTSAHNVLLVNKRFKTEIYSISNYKQKYLYSAFNLNTLNHRMGYLDSFFRNMHLHNYANFAGLMLRLDMLEHIEKSNQYIYQCKTNTIAYVIQDRLIYRHIYFAPHPQAMANFQTRYYRERLYLLNLQEKNNDRLLDDIKSLEDAKLYEIIKKSNPLWFIAYDQKLKNTHNWIYGSRDNWLF